jgi:hypothetical protein
MSYPVSPPPEPGDYPRGFYKRLFAQVRFFGESPVRAISVKMSGTDRDVHNFVRDQGTLAQYKSRVMISTLRLHFFFIDLSKTLNNQALWKPSSIAVMCSQAIDTSS